MSTILVFFVIGLLFLLAIFSGHEDIWYLIDIPRHEWYRELRRDYHTSWQQFWRDWRLFKRFAKQNGPWIYASLFGSIGLILTLGLLIVSLPNNVKASVRGIYSDSIAKNQSTFVNSEGSLDTRTRTTVVAEPLAQEESVLVYIPPSQFQPFVRVAEPDIDLRSRFDPLPTQLEPKFEPEIQQPSVQQPEPPPVVQQRTAPDFDVLFADPPILQRDPERLPEPVVDLPDPGGFELSIDRTFSVTSAVAVDLEESYRTLGGDRWFPEDKQRVPRPRPILYQDRHSDVQLSSHERERIGRSDDLIRIRPRAAGREISPGLLVTKSVPHHAVAGTEFKYDIDVSNPHPDTVPSIIVEEIVPAGWSIIDAEPRGMLIGKDTLRWDIDGLRTDQSQRFTIRVLAAGDEAAMTRTILTTGAAVETVTNFQIEVINTPEPAIEESIEPAPMISNPSKWQASDQIIAEPARDLTITPPTLPPSIARRVEASLELDVVVPERVPLGAVQIKFVVKNTGTLPVNDARLLVAIAKELVHPRGGRINQAVGPLAPGKTRTLVLDLRAIAPGAPVCDVVLRTRSTVYDRGQAVFAVESAASARPRIPASTAAPAPTPVPIPDRLPAAAPGSSQGWRAR